MEKKKQVLNGLHCLTVNWKDALGVHQHDHALVSKEDGNFSSSMGIRPHAVYV
jgi:hypothetical protein